MVRIADQLVDARRLDSRDDVFELTFADLQKAVDDADFDVRSQAATSGAFYRQLKRQVRHFPHVIDSRGRIPRPERRGDDASTLHGGAMSPGVARGPAKVLNDPFEQTVEPGDVLVAVTTDPGWTPLFVNAAAVVLEIGGELQHGALVAREFGKPCVAGIADVMNRIRNGQTIEVDGAAGDGADHPLTRKPGAPNTLTLRAAMSHVPGSCGGYMVGRLGFEPRTNELKARCSTN